MYFYFEIRGYILSVQLLSRIIRSSAIDLSLLSCYAALLLQYFSANEQYFFSLVTKHPVKFQPNEQVAPISDQTVHLQLHLHYILVFLYNNNDARY
jgi:hypothetical protein